MKNPREESFESIYRICFPKLVAYLQPHTLNLQDAEDIASQTMHLLWRKWDTLPTHTQKGILCWLFTAARNYLHEKARKEAHSPTVISWEELPPQWHPEAPPDADPKCIEEEYRKCLQELLGQLSEKESRLLLDKIERRLSDEEIAAKYGISVNAMRIRWSRTKDRIEALMKLSPRNHISQNGENGKEETK